MKNSLRLLFKLVLGLGFLFATLWLGGMFSQPSIAPGVLAAPPDEGAPRQTTQAARVEHALLYRAVGTVESSREVNVAARMPGQVLALHAELGDSVKAGDVLAELDGRDVEARVSQARSGLAAAEAQATQASQALERTRALFGRNAATAAQLEAAESGAAAATAAVEAARQQVTEAEVALGYLKVVAPMDGVVSARPFEPGDLAFPGAALYTLLDPSSLRVAAWVREGALDHVAVGGRYPVEVPSRHLTLESEVVEIVPAVDPRSRSFLVRAALPETQGLQAGMFARLVLEVGQREVVEVDRRAVRAIGQLDTVLVKVGDRWVRRYVTLGVEADGTVEVLTGLSGGETLGWSE
ncbi:MAG: efflux RND transporter periplasmic adaptor subunit [Planctomycetes bacterium]|nr:efflux RND transporter periplasmic adaptor subunit [Planctomycetota bacterium]